MKKKCLALSYLLVFLMMICPVSSSAILNIELTKGMRAAMPIAVVPFAGQPANGDEDNNIASIVHDDLANSGRFQLMDPSEMQQMPHAVDGIDLTYWRSHHMDNVLVGRVERISGGSSYRVSFSLVSVFGGSNKTTSSEKQIILDRQLLVNENNLRATAHRVSDAVYQALTGQRGIFSTKIAYVTVTDSGKGQRHILQIADADGFHPQPILNSPQPIMSPAWSPDGKRLAYVSFEKDHSQILISTIATGARTLLTNFPGINGAPAWSPDGGKIAMALSKDGSAKIYVMDLVTKSLQKISDGNAIDTEPAWSPDGKSILFTSDRGGQPQIYQTSASGGPAKRVTFTGDYNARASYSHDGRSILMLHREGRGMGYNVGILDVASGQFKKLSGDGRVETPSFAPNGQMALYATKENGRGVLGVVSTDGNVSLRLPAAEGNVQEPAWSPFL